MCFIKAICHTSLQRNLMTSNCSLNRDGLFELLSNSLRQKRRRDGEDASARQSTVPLCLQSNGVLGSDESVRITRVPELVCFDRKSMGGGS